MTAGPGQEPSSAPSPLGDLSTGPSKALPRRRGSQEGCLAPLQLPAFLSSSGPRLVWGVPHSGHTTPWPWTLVSAGDWVLWHLAY